MNLRLLDPATWRVDSYDVKTGEVVLLRGAKPRFVDQFSSRVEVEPKQKERTGKVWQRDGRVRDAVLLRANGRCEYCGKPGFRTVVGDTYLETHHVIPLSEKGADSTSNVVALCPNDHREAHRGEQRRAIRAVLLKKLGR
jgi:5-methylcytosine-specific restriction endonuclease McrA